MRALFLLSCICCAPCFAESAFTFVALGDTAYHPVSYRPYEKLIDNINAIKPAFSIHVGDTQGHQPCNQQSTLRIANFFARFDHPVFYTPGDNEWTDCRQKASFHSLFGTEVTEDTYVLNALSNIRFNFFRSPNSLGQKPLIYTRQSDMSSHKQMVENTFWIYNNVLFATVHVVGSNDGLNTHWSTLKAEARKRSQANLAWLKHIEKVATGKEISAVVIAMHASLFDKGKPNKSMRKFSKEYIRGGKKGPYYPIAQRIAAMGAKLSKPLLLIHGDFHTYTVDTPFDIGITGKNITRLQVFGEPVLNAVTISVLPGQSAPFKIAPLISPQ